MKLKSIKILAYLVSCYLLVAHAMGSAIVAAYLSVVPGGKRVLETKGIKLLTFSVFTTVSTFSNCGFVPTNENMVVFRKNPGLLLILIPQILMGNTLYPVFLRFSIWFMAKMTRRAEFRHMLESSRELGYGGHLIPGLNTVCLGITALGLIVVQLVVFCSLEWNSESIGGFSVYEKVVGIVFQVVNSRHTGESVFDLSALQIIELIFFIVIFVLKCVTLHFEKKKLDKYHIEQAENGPTRKNKGFWEHILFSKLTYLFLFIFLICITERHKMKRDPLNFNVLNIVVEVVSAYGNVGFSVGYSCERQINPDGRCKDAWYGFVGKWSDEGKFLLVIVMFVGRLKKFNKRGGRAWSLA
ncbi:sodium transporter hkt1 [Phtheirospermum japonicum]|uniref:Sodium transporter hkt1 n=1 Tax=Phtheirospermum japonicum TaxID=374723 RepID=A0A830B5G0_9LAMI|nr:sodium transporter hkt1 [Phtheirospermum japonicum]